MKWPTCSRVELGKSLALLGSKIWLKEMNVIRYKEEAEIVDMWDLCLCFREEWNKEG